MSPVYPSRGARYFLSEGLQAFRRNGLMSLAAVTVTVVTLVALGAALVVAGALDYIARRLESQVQTIVYLKDGLADNAVAAVRAGLESLPGVTDVTYVSKGEALDRLRRSIGGGVQFRDLLARNPLPASFVVSADRPDRLDAIAAAAQRLPGVETASYGGGAVGRLFALTRVVRVFGAVVGGALALVALVIIASTIRLTVFARRAEIEVMRLVGATAWFIRWPFVVEGAVTGACGAAGAFVAVAGLYALVVHSARSSLPFLPLPEPEQVALGLLWKLLVWGVVIGVVGSLLAVRRHLRV
ncbi:MAG TPA: permease-like cell division protein FtsX [bacterium]|nr:permease-like cell division protein FtsX [bacterium]